MKVVVSNNLGIQKGGLDFYAKKAVDLVANSQSRNTRKAYKNDLKQYERFCLDEDLKPYPASKEVLALYVSYMTTKFKTATINRRLVSLGSHHRRNGWADYTSDPQIKMLMNGVKRTLGTAQDRKRPLEDKDIIKLIYQMGDRLIDKRNKLLLLFGFIGAFRRSEIIGLDVADITFVQTGVKVHLNQSKTDQAKKGADIYIHYSENKDLCPVQHLQDYLAAAGINEGAIFRQINRHGQPLERMTGDGLSYALKQMAAIIGADPSQIGGHSLRRGSLTTAGRKGVPLSEIRKMGRFSPLSNTVIRYMEESKAASFNRTNALLQ
jgi:site-specific recombinase XerD